LGSPSRAALVGTVISPAVRLSPKDRNFVRASRGEVCAVTITLKPQSRVVRTLSVAVHCTGVVPRGNGEPDTRSHVTCTGGTPPVVVGVGKVTDTAAPVNETVLMSAGQVIVSAAAGIDVVVVDVAGTVDVVVVVVAGGDGEFGEEQPAAATLTRKSPYVAGRHPRIRQDIGRCS
jgi:hypothetical protein